MSLPACTACGSKQLRRVRSRGVVQRTVRSLTSLRRYTCLDCRHQGWARGLVPWDAGSAPRPTPLPGRPLEARDHDFERRRRYAFAASLLTAILAGSVVALVVDWAGRP